MFWIHTARIRIVSGAYLLYAPGVGLLLLHWLCSWSKFKYYPRLFFMLQSKHRDNSEQLVLEHSSVGPKCKISQNFTKVETEIGQHSYLLNEGNHNEEKLEKVAIWGKMRKVKILPTRDSEGLWGRLKPWEKYIFSTQQPVTGNWTALITES